MKRKEKKRNSAEAKINQCCQSQFYPSTRILSLHNVVTLVTLDQYDNFCEIKIREESGEEWMNYDIIFNLLGLLLFATTTSRVDNTGRYQI